MWGCSERCHSGRETDLNSEYDKVKWGFTAEERVGWWGGNDPEEMETPERMGFRLNPPNRILAAGALG